MNPAAFFLIGYLAILAVHAGWALFIIRNRLADLAVGPVRKSKHVMIGLFALNLPSVVVFLPAMGVASIPQAFGNSAACLAHGLYHILLFVEEVFRVRRDPVRGAFLANHCAWAVLLMAYAIWQSR